MRFLSNLILLSFLFITPFQGNAGKISGNTSTLNIENSAPGNQFIDYSIGDDHDIAVNYSGHRNTINQRKFHPFTNLLNSAGFKNNAEFFYETKLVARPHSYCKRIGLKLLFPEHYFW